MLPVRGVSYLCDGVPGDALHRDLSAIRHDLRCTAVMLIGADGDALVGAARAALDVGLDVHLRPHVPDRRRRELLAHLAGTAQAAEQLRTRFPGRVTLLVGSEFSHTAPGIVPGPRSFIRLQVVLRWRRVLRRRVTRRLDALLVEAVATARRHFTGPLTYAAAGWEQVDWSRFDVVGVSLYRGGTDPAAYRDRLRALVRGHRKPVVITEFGCGAFVGADRRGAASFRIVDWFADPPRVRDGHVRDEGAQAGYLGELIDLYAAEGVHGCFAFTFVMRDFPHRPDPAEDLDMAGFGLVKVPPDDPLAWAPKAAFHTVAERYRALG
ncbi:MAG TPA: hypothetical protein VEZ42_17070 [Pseudonocardia sp.]|nr:hypothetical protein [Pseudonocardia sp.]